MRCAIARQHRRELDTRKHVDITARRSRASRASTGASSTASCRPTCSKQYDVREVIARLVDGSDFDEFKALYGDDARHRLCPHPRHAGRHRRQQRHPVLGIGAEGRAFHRALLPAANPAALPAEHHRLHGGPRVRGGRHRQGRRQAGHRGRLRRGAEDHGDRRRLVRRGQLRHVRARLRAALPVHLAQCAHLGDGRRAGGVRARHRAPRQHRGGGRHVVARRTRRPSRRRSARATRRRATPTTPPRGSGTTASSCPPKRATCSASRFSACLNAPIEETRFGVFRM